MRPPTKITVGMRFSDRPIVIELFNSSLERMAALRIPQVTADFLKSKIAWKLSVLHQAILHRTVALADGVAISLNGDNPLSAIVLARSLTETVALLHHLAQGITDRLLRSDLKGLNDLFDNTTFATRDEIFVADHPISKATNVLTYIDKLDHDMPGLRKHYDFMSEMCHPNRAGHAEFFGKLDVETGITHFSEEMDPIWSERLLGPTLASLAYAEKVLEGLRKAVDDIDA